METVRPKVEIGMRNQDSGSRIQEGVIPTAHSLGTPIPVNSPLSTLLPFPTHYPRSTTHLLIAVVALVFLAGSASAQSYRFVFFGPRSPVLIEAQISAGNWDLNRIRQQYAAGLLKRLDKDQDGTLSGEEAAELPSGGRFTAGAEKLGVAAMRYDTNPADGKIDETELLTFLETVFGPPLTVEKMAPRLAQTVRLYAELDADKDNRITPDEFRDGLAKLKLSDFDDDETLSVAELQPYPLSVVQAQQAMEAATPEGQSMPLVLATTEDDRKAAATRVSKEYAQGNEISDAARLGIPERFLKAFDADKSGALSEEELARYLEKAPAQLNLQVSLLPPFVQTGRISSVTTDVKVIEEGRRPKLDLAGIEVECVARNRGADVRDQVNLYKTRAMTADADMNGYLDAGEFNGLQAPGAMFQDVDLDKNDQVTRDEVDQYFSLDGLAAQSRLVATLSDEAKVLFNLLDSSSDNRLSLREIETAGDVIKQFDRDGDGALALQELASQYRITFSQPELLDFRPDANANPQSRQGIVRQDSSGPLWFRRMDRNLDNDLSWREFLGTREDFNRIDTNGDGLINLEEAEAAEAMRK